MVRLESWADRTDGLTGLLVVEREGGAVALVVRISARPPGVSVGTRLMVRGAAHASREDLLDAVPMEPAGRETLRGIGLLDPDAIHLADDILQTLAGLGRGGRPYQAASQDGAPGGPAHDFGYPKATRRPHHIPWHAASGTRPGSSIPLPEAPVGDAVRSLCPDGAPSVPGARPLLRRLADLLVPWLHAIGTRIQPPEAPWLDGDRWTPEAFAFYGAPGEIGRRRREAAVLQPAFAPTLPLAPGLAALIDAGRPFEHALAMHAATRSSDARMHLRPAAMRRLRTLRRAVPTGDLAPILSSLARLPDHMIPRTPEDWVRFQGLGVWMVRSVGERHGIPDSQFFRGMTHEWQSQALPPGDIRLLDMAEFGRATVSGLHDIAGRFMDEILRPGPALIPLEAEGRVIGGTLFAGRSMTEIALLNGRWHADDLVVQAVRHAIPMPSGEVSWPALFDPHVAGNGVAIRCLTSPAELIDEGGTGPDADGFDGLAHCVGGYAANCLRGETHVASVRAVNGARLSTVSFVIEDGGPFVEQHYGRRNGKPPKDADLAVGELVSLFASGRLKTNPESFAIRDLPVGRSGTLACAEALFPFWAPHLPHRFRRGGLASLHAEVRRLLDAPAG
jgi:hypothetical protein